MTKVILQIESLARGEAIARHDGRVVFVEGAVPGDRVEVELQEEKGRSAKGQLLRVLEPSPHRRTPACPHADRCGGCQWLHVDEKAQAAAKEALFYGALERIGGVARTDLDARPIILSRAALGYRHRAKFHLRKRQLGFAARASHELVEIERCGLLTPPLQEALGRLKEAVRELGPPPGSTDVSLATDGKRVSAAFHGAKTSAAAVERAGQIRGRARLDGVLLVPEAGPMKASGEVLLRHAAPHAPGVTLYGRADLFAQANLETNPELVRIALEALGDAKQVLELHSGAGNFTFAMHASGRTITAVEYAADSLELARRSAREAKLDGIRFVQGDALKIAAGLAAEGARFDALLLDPPRTGARGIGAVAGALAVQTVVYVSCDPATLARDVRELVEAGFRPVEATPVDMFPQTFHVEGVVRLERR